MSEKKFNFAKSFSELEKIIQELESGQVDLDDGLKKYERGLELATACQKKLKEVENKVQLIKAKFDSTEAPTNAKA